MDEPILNQSVTVAFLSGGSESKLRKLASRTLYGDWLANTVQYTVTRKHTYGCGLLTNYTLEKEQETIIEAKPAADDKMFTTFRSCAPERIRLCPNEY